MAKRKHVKYSARQAAKKNAEDRAYHDRIRKRIDFWNKYGKKLLILIGVVAVVTLMIIAGINWFVGVDGAIPGLFGKLNGVQSNWIVTNLETSPKTKYYKLGEFDIPSGFTADPNYDARTDDPHKQTFYITADDPASPVRAVYVSGVSKRKAEDMANQVKSYGLSLSSSDVKHANICGRDVVYIYQVIDNDAENKSENHPRCFSQLSMYQDTVKDSSVLMSISSQIAPQADVATEDALLKEAENFLPNLRVTAP